MERARSQKFEERQELRQKNIPEVGDEAEYQPAGSIWVNRIQVGVQSDDANTSEDENVPELGDEAKLMDPISTRFTIWTINRTTVLLKIWTMGQISGWFKIWTMDRMSSRYDDRSVDFEGFLYLLSTFVSNFQKYITQNGW